MGRFGADRFGRLRRYDCRFEEMVYLHGTSSQL
jgi:hypothetical protein